MDLLFPIILFLIPILIAFKLCEWQVVTAFILALIAVPAVMILSFHFFEIFYLNKSSDFAEAFTISGMFSIFGFPIYLIIVLPLYYFLQSLQFPLHYSFPMIITILMIILFVLITEKEWGWKEIVVILLCSYVHSYFILWLISKLKYFSLGD